MKVVDNDILQGDERKERGGGLVTLKDFLLFDDSNSFSSAVLLSQVLSVIHLESLGHLHQIQVYLQLAESMPVTIDKNL